MEISRRNFVKFLVGGAAGIQITPLPWKLTDDVAIWTQNWSWVPTPPVGEFTTVKSVCNLCPGGCGIEVRKVDDRAVKIEGRTDFPINPGGICPLGMGGLQLLYDEGIRYTGPMKRVGPRGAGTFKDITWDEALDLLAKKISGLRNDGRPEALAAIDGNPIRSTMSVMIERLLRTVGSPNYVRIPSVEDTYWLTSILTQGTEGPMAYDLENADYILSFGSGLLDGWGSPGRVINAWSLWRGDTLKKKTRVVQIESRASNTASKADKWVTARPGSEAALALGLGHVLVKEHLYDSEFVDRYCFGFNGWQSADGRVHEGFKNMLLKQYPPSKVAAITGLDPEEIISLAKGFATAKAPIAICGKGKGTLNGSLFEFMAVHSLNALIGNINRSGGVLVYDPLPLSPLSKVSADAIALEGLRKPRLDHAGSARYPFTQSLINNLTEAIIESRESPVDTLLIFSANPVYTLPDSGAFKKALEKVPFIVSFSPFRDETSYMADLVLPDHTYLEKRDDVVWPTGLQYPIYGLSQPVIKALYDTKNTGDVIISLARQIDKPVGAAFPWSDYEEVLKARARGLFYSGPGMVSYDGAQPVWTRQAKANDFSADYTSFGEMWEKIKAGGLWYRPLRIRERRERLFKTPTGKFEFFSTQIELAVYDYSRRTSKKLALNHMGIAETGDTVFMPHYEEVRPDVDRSEYPLLMIPYEIINLSSTWVPNPPFLNKTLFDTQLNGNESFADINPETAAKYSLRQNDRVIVKSPAGEVRVLVNLFEGAMPDVIYILLGLGHRAYDEFQLGKGINPKDIINAGKDPLSGHPIWWNTPVKLIRV